MTDDELKKGLEGVLVAESELSFIDGDAGQLVYRGYPIEDLARKASYEEVLYLLWYGTLPTRDELDTFADTMAAHRSIDEGLERAIRDLATRDDNPMASLRSAISMLSATDSDSANASPDDREANLAKGRRITAKIPTIIASFVRLRNGEDPVAPREDLGHAANFLYMLNGDVAHEVTEETFDTALVLHADHGLNASTFSAMVTASTLSDLYSAITSAVGTLKGPLHGGANQNVMQLLQDIDAAGVDPVDYVEDALERDERVPGFGHRVYNVKDPRAKILGGMSEDLGEAGGDTRWYEYSAAIEEFMVEEKGLAPNVDFYSASTYYQMGIPLDIYTPIFAMSRVGGWIAHVLEQYEDNRLIRPRARYVGQKNRNFVPITER